MQGIHNILKPPGMTSHDVVDVIRKRFKVKKVGHLGTLDPQASGVLPLCIGKATKMSQYLLNQGKQYRFELTMGIVTDTLDGEGKVINSHPIEEEHITRLKQTYPNFIGRYIQKPPMYSAIKVQGKKLYQYAREGKNVHRPGREVEIYNLDLIHEYEYFGISRFLFQVDCSKGTYIRVLADDLAKEAAAIGGCMSFLLRTKSGPFKLQDSLTIEEIDAMTLEERVNSLLPVDRALTFLPSIVLDDHDSKLFINGNKISLPSYKQCLYRVYDENYNFLGIGQRLADKSLKPDKVLG